MISHSDCACQTPGHLSCSDLGRAQNSGPTESGPLRSTQVPGKSHGWRSLVGCSPWGCEESDTTERLHFHFSLSCIGEGNGNPLQCSCLENPRVREAWWAAVSEVAQSRTRLKRLSSKCLKLSGLDLGSAYNPGPASDSFWQSNLEPKHCRQGKHTCRERGQIQCG